MKFLEKDLEEILHTSDREELKSRGLNINGKLLRQVKIGAYGVADLIGVSRDTHIYNGQVSRQWLSVTIYELKKDKIGISAFLQALNYLRGIDSYLGKRGNLDYDLNIVLIGSKIDNNSSFIYLPDYLTDGFLSNYTYSYDVDGLSFKEHYGYKLMNEGLSHED